MGFLDSLETYGQSWEVVGREALSSEDKKAVNKITVVEKEQEWGTSISMCFMMAGGGQKFVALSRDCDLEPGEIVDPETVEILELERDGETIYRAEGEAIKVEEKPKRGRK